MSDACKSIFTGVKLMAMTGKPHSGKTSFIIKMVSYITQRMRTKDQSTYGTCIYLNMADYFSWLNFQISASCKNKNRFWDGVTKNESVGLSKVLEKVRSQRCFFVLDHCNNLAERNR